MRAGESSPPSRRRDLFALGLFLARSRLSVVLALIFALMTTLVLAGFGAFAAARGRPLAASFPGVSSEILAWGPGILIAFSAALHALKRDREDGIYALVMGRGVSVGSFVVARAAALAALLAGAVTLGTVAVMVFTWLRADSGSLAAASLLSGFAGIIHGLGFGMVMAPVTLATLGARSRGGGYLALLLVLVLPELLRLAAFDLPREWSEVLSIPACLATIRSALSAGGAEGGGHVEFARALSALIVLGVASAVATAAAIYQAERTVRRPLPLPIEGA